MCQSFTSRTIILYVTAKNIDVSSLHVSFTGPVICKKLTCMLLLWYKRSNPLPWVLCVSSPGEWSVGPQCGWSWGLPSSGLKAPFPPPVPPISPSGPLLYEACMLTTSSKYIRKQRGRGDILNDKKKTVIPYHSHHQRTKILPDFTCFKGEQKTKKKKNGGKGPLVTLKFCI